MGIVTSTIGKDHYTTHIHTAANALIADEPKINEGQELGFSPEELLCASLAACTCITLRMYADRKELQLDSVDVIITKEGEIRENNVVLTRQLSFHGRLDEAQRKRLVEIADMCPIHHLLSNPVTIHTVLL